MIRYALLIIFTVSNPFLLLANDEIRKAKTLGRDIGTSLSGKIEQFVRTDISVNKGKDDLGTGGILNFQGVNLPETQYTDGGMASAAQSKINENEESDTIHKAFLRQKDFRMKSSDSFLDKAHHAQKNPMKYIDWLEGGYNGCDDIEGDNILAKETKVCDEYHQTSENQCHIGRRIEVSAHHKYECSLKRLLSNKTCKSKLQVSIEKKVGCEVDKEIANSIKNANYNSSIITVGRSGGVERVNPAVKITSSFMIKDKTQLNQLLLKRAHFPCVVRILFNNTQIYSYPNGTNQLGFQLIETGGDMVYHEWVVFTGIRTLDVYGPSVEYYDQNQLNIDLLPYVLNGVNTVTIESVDNYAFPTWIEISTLNNCINEKEQWEETCQD